MLKALFNVLLISAAVLGGCQSQNNNNSETDAKTDEQKPVPTGDNSQNALDWEGTYQGTLPCADCEGIQTEIILKGDESFTMTTQYLGKDDERNVSTGSFKWDESGSNITLNEDPNLQYKVGEFVLFKLDNEGNRITGELSENYMLRKIDDQITERYWKLSSLNGIPITVAETQPREAHFILKNQEKKVNGHTGCNVMNGTFETGPDRKLEFKGMISTRRACMNVPYESEFTQMLDKVRSYNLVGDTLILKSESDAELAKLYSVYFR
ncbi:copper resistance protein NlpE N-terminal domain-containing protein [Fulvivirga lutimaris]|uniref:copper resistance protein NlpE N-terminal domain-containing protein n=1 Tax=Fulvivirga lutimaris TaxID=1819566 RepID=UPI0012BD7862|nr:copper resistance protein NlpE N-terminal domain-containing protein [Fulvivirga lutimaris]MTI41081.1 META domain-containing protein [Fulvivirga lutimaris]